MIGHDLIEVDRIKNAHKKHGNNFLNRLFTEKELAYCLNCVNPYARLAGRFAAKEAIAKALGTGFGSKLSWKDIEILPDNQGKPIVYLCENLKAKHQDLVIHVSITHVKDYASAVALVN